MLSFKQRIVKRIVDIVISIIGIVIFIIPIFVLVLLSTIVNKELGIFTQKRVGYKAKLFTIYKIKTMKNGSSKINSFGSFLRASKLDELPQLFNVLFGKMSMVGPRPDVIGYADTLKGKDKIILTVKPGITSLATLKFKNEEQILNTQENPLKYNDEVLWPEKVKLNKEYVKNYNFKKDIKIILKTIQQIVN